MAGLASIGIKLSADGTDLPNLQSTPDIGGTPEKIDVTTLADSTRQYVNGVKDPGDLDFVFLYDKDQENSSYETLSGKVGDPDTKYVLTLPDNSTFTFTADVSLRLNAAEVNGAITYTASFALQSEIEEGTAAG